MKEKSILFFTMNLTELLESGVPLAKAMRVMESMSAGPEDVKRGCCEIRQELMCGAKLSFALSVCSSLHFDQWYLAFINAAQESGNITETLKFLCGILTEQKKAGEKFISAALYPLGVSIMAAVLSLASALFFTKITPGSSGFAQAFQSWLLGALFMFMAVCGCIFVLKKILEPDSCVSLFKALSFLTESGIPIVQAIESSIPVIYGRNILVEVMTEIKRGLLNGEKVSECFGFCLEKAGFTYESKILSSNLALCETTGSDSAFSKSAQILEKRREKLRKRVLGMEQPVLLSMTALYMIIVLKSTLLPFLTGFGGLM